ncbi:MAG: hypothetical protein IPP37_20365 [Saprospiraceae bacterium]|nr:hypothetical protein [Saprospiraceae bacterium]
MGFVGATFFRVPAYFLRVWQQPRSGVPLYAMGNAWKMAPLAAWNPIGAGIDPDEGWQ